MLNTRIRQALVTLVVLLAGLSWGSPASAAPGDAGSVNFAKAAESSFDRFTLAPSAAEQAWMRSHYWRMRAYAPYFDSRLSWYGDAWAYQDLYAIYRGSDVATQHPEWILKDANGNKLYIPFGCSGGTCPQYAGDFGNQEFRNWWIKEAAAKMSKGYRGLFIDDVNMDMRVGNGSGSPVAPVDPRSGTTMSESAWRRQMAEFTEQVRHALPAKEIVHNAIWYAGCGAAAGSCWSDPYIRRELQAADYIELERGVNDGGITGGGGKWGYESFMARIDWLHSQGKGVIFDSQASGTEAREYGLASYLLVSTGRDALGNEQGGTPADWWSGYSVDLGPAAGARHSTGGLLRRDFARGYVLVNQPGAATRTVALAPGSTGPDGTPRSSVQLDGGEGAVVVTAGASAEAPHPTQTAVFPQPNPTTTPAGAAPARRLRLPRAVLVRGRVKRGSRGRAHVRVERRSGSRWVTVFRTRARVRNGRFSSLVRGLPPGRYRVRASYLGNAVAAVSSSRPRAFRIRR